MKKLLAILCLMIGIVKSQVVIKNTVSVKITNQQPANYDYLKDKPSEPSKSGEDMLNDAYKKHGLDTKENKGSQSFEHNGYKFSGGVVYDTQSYESRVYGSNPRYYSKSVLNLRSDADMNSAIISKVEAYEYLRVIETQPYGISSSYWKVYYPAKDKVGYVAKAKLISDPE